MAKKKIEYNENCKACSGTGLFSGPGEGKGFAVVCEACKGSGCIQKVLEYENFTGRILRDDVKQVLECNPGITIEIDKKKNINYKNFGGMDYDDWLKGKKFKPGMEMRKYTCTFWYYGYINPKIRPKWKKCSYLSFHTCSHFKEMKKCWKEWDKEFNFDTLK